MVLVLGSKMRQMVVNHTNSKRVSVNKYGGRRSKKQGGSLGPSRLQTRTLIMMLFFDQNLFWCRSLRVSAQCCVLVSLALCSKAVSLIAPNTSCRRRPYACLTQPERLEQLERDWIELSILVTVAVQ